MQGLFIKCRKLKLLPDLSDCKEIR
jgi:hypothetical protein